MMTLALFVDPLHLRSVKISGQEKCKIFNILDSKDIFYM